MRVNREFLETNDFESRQGKDVEWIVLHYTGNWTDKAVNNCKYARREKLNRSAHVYVDEDGAWQSVPYSYAAWSVGKNYGHLNLFGKCTNYNSISVEMCSRGGTIQPKTIDNTVELVKDLMQAYAIDTDHVVRHWDVCSKNCPGWYGWNPSTGSEQLWFDFKARLQAPKEEVSDNFDLIFNAADYRAYNGIEGDDLSVFFHFWGVGMDEGKRGSFWFDPKFYADQNGDLREAFGILCRPYYEHFMRYGYREGRFPLDLSPVYDWEFYKANYWDLQEALGDDQTSYLTHFLLYGMKEGRQAHKDFDPVTYRMRYPDLDNAFGDDWRSYYRHYLEYGINEGRAGDGNRYRRDNDARL